MKGFREEGDTAVCFFFYIIPAAVSDILMGAGVDVARSAGRLL